MTELILKMTFWLLTAMALGFIIAWLLSRTIYKKEQAYKEDSLSALILERNNMVEKLEKSFRNKNVMSQKLSEDLKRSEEALGEKTSLLTTLQHKLVNSNLNEKHNVLLVKIRKLEELDKKRVKELEEFGDIVVLAEDKLEEHEKNYQKIVKKLDNKIKYLAIENEKYRKSIHVYQKNIIVLEESLKLYEADSSEPEFIISKDQFLKIEEQLEVYKKEIELLKIEKEKLLLKSQKNYNNFNFQERRVEERMIDEFNKEGDDGVMVKAFRKTYKKITNS